MDRRVPRPNLLRLGEQLSGLLLFDPSPTMRALAFMPPLPLGWRGGSEELVEISQPVIHRLDVYDLGGEAVAGRVRPRLLVVLRPALDAGPGLGEAGEDLLVWAFVAEAADEALDEGVLYWLAGGDLVPRDIGSVGPQEYGLRRQLSALVANNHCRSAAPGDQAIEPTHDVSTAVRGVNDESLASPVKSSRTAGRGTGGPTKACGPRRRTTSAGSAPAGPLSAPPCR